MESRDYHRLTLIVGPEGSGKTALLAELAKNVSFYKIIPVTTRPMHADEADGADFNFISWEKYRELAENDQLISTFLKKGNYYGVTYEEFDRAMEKGLPVVWVVNLEEALKIKVRYPNVKTVLVIARLDSIRRRLEQKGIKTEGMINSKLIEAKLITDQAPRLDYIVVIEDEKLGKAVEQLKEIILKEPEI